MSTCRECVLCTTSQIMLHDPLSDNTNTWGTNRTIKLQDTTRM